VSRLAATLESAGYLQRIGERGRYRLGPKLVRLGELSRAEQDLRSLMRPIMMDLVAACGETVHLGIREGAECVTIDFVEGTHTVRMTTSIGKRGKLYGTSIGKCLLAWSLPEERDALIAGFAFERRTSKTIVSADTLTRELNTVLKDGFAVDMEEAEIGLSCIGAPIFDAGNKAIAAISISGPTSRINRKTLSRLVRLVRSAAKEASTRLGAPKNGASGPAIPVLRQRSQGRSKKN
jgi:DNA-binding IclR family transcriptional regulator